MRTGLSLSLCVAEIIADRVRVEDVDVIVAATQAHTEADWRWVTDQYCRSYWRADPQRARRVVQLLRDADRIRQPRVEGGEHPGVSQGIWQEPQPA